MIKFDTSGMIDMHPEDEQDRGHLISWRSLTPFAQGYVEELFSAGVAPQTLWPCRFQDLAPETLARIIADCEAFVAERAGFESNNMALTYQALGAKFWTARQSCGWGHPRIGVQEMARRFPPLTVTLGDDGKVVFA